MNILITVAHNGKEYVNYTPDQLLDAGVPGEVVEQALEKEKALEKREVVRNIIAQDVGDTASLVGAVSDASGLLIAIALADVVALSSSTDFAKYKKAKLDILKVLAGDADLTALASATLKKIQSGEAVLTASLKGLESVITESLTRSTAVANILSQAAQADLEGE